MSAAAQVEKDLIDRIADALPVEVRADYLQELRHCRSLPENDEMLRILRAMQFLTLLIQGAPSRLAEERQSLDTALRDCLRGLSETTARLDALPREVASGISPEAIAGRINESLRQRFVQSTIPKTGEALTVVAAQMKRTVTEFQQASAAVSLAHRNAASETDQAVRRIESTVRSALRASQDATTELTTTFLHEYRWSIGLITTVALLTGIALGTLWQSSRMPPPMTECPAVIEKTPPAKSKR